MGEVRKRGKPLTAAFVKTVTAPGKYHDNQGMGLFIKVEPNGKKYWIQRVTGSSA